MHMSYLVLSCTTALITLDDISTEPLRRKTLATATSGLNVVLWIALISFPFIQVIEKNKTCILEYYALIGHMLN